MKTRFTQGLAVVGWLMAETVTAQAPHERPARVDVRLRMVAENPPPVGVNELGDMGGTAYGRGNLIADWSFEPAAIRHRYRAQNSGIENGRPWVELDGPGISRYEQVTSGYLSGADYRVYRIVDADGQALPLLPDDDYLDLTHAARYERVDEGQVPEAGAPGFPDGGWILETYTGATGPGMTRSGLIWTDAFWIENGTTNYYIVSAVNAAGQDSFVRDHLVAPGNAVEVGASGEAGSTNGPFIASGSGGGNNDLLDAVEGGWFGFEPVAAGATGTITWELLDAENNPIMPPAGLGFDPLTGGLSGTPTNTPPPTFLRWRLTADNGVVTRDFTLNPTPWTPQEPGDLPDPPQNVAVIAGDGFVHLSWQPSPSTNVVGYRVYRSPVPLAQNRARVYLADGAPQPQRWDYLHFDKEVIDPDPNWSHPRLRTGRIEDVWHQWDPSGQLRTARVPHPVAPPPEWQFPGDTCLAITSSVSHVEELNGPTLFYPVDESRESLFYAYLEPGETYRYEAWLRQDGLSNNQVRFTFWGQYQEIEETFAVDGDWQLYGFEFVAPSVPTQSFHGGPALTFAGPGTLYMDNVRLLKSDRESGTPGLELPGQLNLDTLQAFNPEQGPKGVLRNMWTSLGPHFMPKLLSLTRDSGLMFSWFQNWSPNSRPSLPQHLQIAYLTGDSPTNRMKPWVNLSGYATTEEAAMLFEYLTEPINPNDPVDVAAKPWAYLRYQQRGTNTPWVDEFPGMIIEFANEPWHNQAVEESWFGHGRTFYVNDGGLEHGLYVRYMLDAIVAATPRLAQLRADGRLSFQMGNSYFEFAENGVMHLDQIEALGQATYVGPRWETGDAPNSAFTDEGVQATLLAYAENVFHDMDRWRRSRERVGDIHGVLYDFFAYEGGPSGYALPGTADEATEHIGELYGKSLAMGVSSLDAWLGAYEAGFTEMAYYAFAARNRWASHTPHSLNYPNGFQPHPGWLALQLRNRHARGHLIDVVVPEAPVLHRDGQDIPLIGSYAFIDGNRLAVFLLSRKLDGEHNDLDFGDGSIPVTLNLPGVPIGSAALYRLEGNPRTNNFAGPAVAIQQSSVTLQQETELSLPAGAIHLYVVEVALDSANEPPSPVQNVDLDHQSGFSRLEWDAEPGATAYRVYRSSIQYFHRTEVGDVFTVENTHFDDFDATGGSEFYYRVAAINAWGEGLASRINLGGINTNAPLFLAPVLGGSGVGDGRLFLNWLSVTGATAYRVGYGGDANGPFTWVEVGDTTAFSLTGLSNGVPVYWTVQASGPAGRGIIADPAVATPLSADTTQALALWNLENATSYEPNQPVTTYSLPVSVTPLTLGPGLEVLADDSPPDYHPLPGSFAFMPVDDFANFGTAGGGSYSNAVDRDLYVAFTVQPSEGFRITLQEIQTGLVFPFSTSTLHVALTYRIGTGAWTQAESGPFPVPGAQWGDLGIPYAEEFTFDLSGEIGLADLEEPVAFRCYLYSLEPQVQHCRAGVRRNTRPDLLIQGSYALTPLGHFRQWQADHFTPQAIQDGHADPHADPHETGIPNWHTYVFGEAAGVFRPVTIALFDGEAFVRFPMRYTVPPDVWWVEYTTNLLSATWTRDDVRIETTIQPGENGFDEIRAEDHQQSLYDHLYYRVVTEPPMGW